MFVYEKKLQYPVKIKNTNPKLAAVIISQYGGPDGELGASLRYLSQRYSMPYAELKGLLTDIGITASNWAALFPVALHLKGPYLRKVVQTCFHPSIPKDHQAVQKILVKGFAFCQTVYDIEYSFFQFLAGGFAAHPVHGCNARSCASYPLPKCFRRKRHPGPLLFFRLSGQVHESEG